VVLEIVEVVEVEPLTVRGRGHRCVHAERAGEPLSPMPEKRTVLLCARVTTPAAPITAAAPRSRNKRSVFIVNAAKTKATRGVEGWVKQLEV